MTQPMPTSPHAGGAGARFVRLAAGPAGLRLEWRGEDGAPPGTHLVDEAEFSALVRSAETELSSPAPDLARIGDGLFRWLDGPEHRLASAGAAPGGLALFVEGLASMRGLPWELLRSSGAFLCAGGMHPITPVRVSVPARPQAPPAARPLGILFMACSPHGVEPVLRFEEEESLILAATRTAAAGVRVEESGSLGGLREAAAGAAAGYDVLHLTGHADVVEGQPVFLVEDDVGEPRLATAADVSRALGGVWPRLVFLSGCRTGEEPTESASLCEALVAAGAPAVLGWSLPVGDDAASVAAAALYGRLAAGATVPDAVAAAREALWRARSPYWHLLRLYADASLPAPLVLPQEVRAGDAAVSAGTEPGLFVGRRRAIQRCLRVLRPAPGEPARAAGVLLHGMGGLGKSALALRLCERMPGHRYVLLRGALDPAALLDALGDRRDEGGTLRERIARRLRDAPQPLLLVLDEIEPSLTRTSDGVPATDPRGHAVLAPPAAEVLADLLAAIGASGAATRVIVTCRYRIHLPPDVEDGLVAEPLERLRGADLEKLALALPGLQRAAEKDRDLYRSALQHGAGNPRLLRTLDAALAAGGDDVEARIRAAAAEAVDANGLHALLRKEAPAFRRFVALASVHDLAVDEEALAHSAGAFPPAYLARAVALGVVEEQRAPGLPPRFAVSPLAAAALAGEVTAEERVAACAAAAIHLGARIPVSDRTPDEAWLEVHRLAMEGGVDAHARDVCGYLASRWIGRSRYADIERLCAATLERLDDAAIHHRIGYARWMLGKSREAQAHFEHALALCTGETGADLRQGSERLHAAVAADLATLVMQHGEPVQAADRLRGVLAGLDPGRMPGPRAATLQRLGGILSMLGRLDEALECFYESLALGQQLGEETVVVGALHGASRVLFLLGDLPRAENALHEALEIARRQGAVGAVAGLLVDLGKVWAYGGNPTGALDLYGQACALYLRLDMPQVLAAALFEMGQLHATLRNLPAAEEFLARSREAAERANDRPGIAASVGASAILHRERGDHDRALEMLGEAYRMNMELGLEPAAAANLHHMAQIHRARGDADRALTLYQASLEQDERMGHTQGVVTTLHDMGALHAERGDFATARTLYERSLEITEQTGLRRARAMALVGLSALARREGDVPRARRAVRAAVAAVAEGEDWAELFPHLVYLGEGEGADATGCLAQAVLLAVRVEAELNAVGAAALLAERLGFESEATLQLMTSLAWRLLPRSERSPFDERQSDLVLSILATLGHRRGVPEPRVREWVMARLQAMHENPVDLEAFLAALVPPGGWLFDPDRLPARNEGGSPAAA
jgi:tetratricopeptide (TPR) repeat protein